MIARARRTGRGRLRLPKNFQTTNPAVLWAATPGGGSITLQTQIPIVLSGNTVAGITYAPGTLTQITSSDPFHLNLIGSGSLTPREHSSLGRRCRMSAAKTAGFWPPEWWFFNAGGPQFVENFVYPDSLLHDNGAWAGTGVIADNFRVQSHVVNQTSTQQTGAQNNSSALPADWTAPWTITFTLSVTPNSDDGVDVSLTTGTIISGAPNGINLNFAAGDFAANQLSNVSWNSTAGGDNFGPLSWTPGVHTVSVIYDGSSVLVMIDATVIGTSSFLPVTDIQAITYVVNNLTHTPMPQLHQITVSHP